MDIFYGLSAIVFFCLFLSKRSDLNNYLRQHGTIEVQRQNLNAYTMQQKNYIEHETAILDARRRKLSHDKKIIETNIEMDLQAAAKKKQFIKDFLDAKIKDYPTVACVLADYMTAYDEKTAAYLAHKKRPAKTASEEVRKIRAEKKKLIAKCKALQWEMDYLKKLFPTIEEIEEDPISEESQYKNPEYQHDDKAGLWLTPQEYASLPTIEKYQRALDRYMRRHKSKREIGLEYERYIGYLYEQENYHVEYHGIEKGLDDLGRDLICKKNGITEIVQCKCWSSHKQIHENHINQLYGTTIMYQLQSIDNTLHYDDKELAFKMEQENVYPVFVTTTTLSDTAQLFAKSLHITVKVIPMGKYPVIKCNIGRNGEKIYHLPFDQQYNRCIIDPKKGEKYVSTVAEAEKLGFRRAKRWRGNR